MSIFILVVNEGEFSVPGDNQGCSNYGCNIRHGPYNTFAMYYCSKLGHTIVMNIWNIDAWQKQKYLTSAVSCYFMSLSDKVSYLLDSIMLLSQIIATMISIVKFEKNNLPFPIEDILKGEFNWNMYEITPPCYVINICILYRLYFKQHGFLKEEIIGYTHANFHHATTFGCRNIAFQIWWLPCNPHRSEWPKTFWAVYESTESQSRSQSGVKLAIKWNSSQNIKFGMKLLPIVWGIYMLNLRAQHCLLTKIFTFNRDMLVGGMYTSYRYTSRGDCALIYHFIWDFMKLSGFVLSQLSNNNF